MTTTRIMTFEVTVGDDWLHPSCHDHDGMDCAEYEADGFKEIGNEIEKTALTAANLRYIESFTEEEWDA